MKRHRGLDPAPIVSRTAPAPGCRWDVRSVAGGPGMARTWYAAPHGLGVYADIRTGRKEIFFLTWREAFDFADEKARTTA